MPMEELHKLARKKETPVYFRAIRGSERVSIIVKKGRSMLEVEEFLFGKPVSREAKMEAVERQKAKAESQKSKVKSRKKKGKKTVGPSSVHVPSTFRNNFDS